MATVTSRRPSIEVALTKLDEINRHAIVLTGFGLSQAAIGASKAWLDEATRIATMPAASRKDAELKVTMLAANMYDWGIQASMVAGLVGAVGLVIGAVGAEAYAWGLDFDKLADPRNVAQYAEICGAELDPDEITAYRANAKPRHLGPAIKRYRSIVAEVDAIMALAKDNGSLADALHRSRDALLDVIAISTRNVADLARKHRAYSAYRDLLDDSRWLFEDGVSVAFKADYLQLGLPAAEVERLKAMFPTSWTRDDRRSYEEWARHNRAR